MSATEQKTTILHQEDGAQTIQLSSDYGNYDVTQTVARITEKGVRIIRLTSEGKPKKFWATNEEMDALAHAWLAYQKEQKEKAEAEQAAECKMIEDALARAKTCPLLTIEELGDADNKRWKLNAEKLGGIHFYYPAEDAAELAEQVDIALKTYESYQKAQAILSTCPYIHVEQDRAHWHVTIPKPSLYGQWATNTRELLACVEQARTAYDSHLAQQAEVA